MKTFLIAYAIGVAMAFVWMFVKNIQNAVAAEYQYPSRGVIAVIGVLSLGSWIIVAICLVITMHRHKVGSLK